jgi:hypothetical protein
VPQIPRSFATSGFADNILPEIPHFLKPRTPQSPRDLQITLCHKSKGFFVTAEFSDNFVPEIPRIFVTAEFADNFLPQSSRDFCNRGIRGLPLRRATNLHYRPFSATAGFVDNFC